MNAPASTPGSAPRRNPHEKARYDRSRPPPAAPVAPPRHPVIEQLAQRHPALFGDSPRPLKRGIFEDLLAAHPGEFASDALKDALARHTRSTRYLAAIANGQQRHDLDGKPVESPTPEQVHHALVEVFRRRAGRNGEEDQRQRLRERIARAFEASGLEPLDYTTRVAGRDEAINALTREALAQVSAKRARDQALQRAFAASGQTLEGFAAMYGLPVSEARRALGRAAGRPAADGCDT